MHDEIISHPSARGADVCRTLDPGTIVLEYLVGDEATYLFAFGRDAELEVHTVEVARGELNSLVTRLLSALSERGNAEETTAGLGEVLQRVGTASRPPR